MSLEKSKDSIIDFCEDGDCIVKQKSTVPADWLDGTSVFFDIRTEHHVSNISDTVDALNEDIKDIKRDLEKETEERIYSVKLIDAKSEKSKSNSKIALLISAIGAAIALLSNLDKIIANVANLIELLFS